MKIEMHMDVPKFVMLTKRERLYFDFASEDDAIAAKTETIKPWKQAQGQTT